MKKILLLALVGSLNFVNAQQSSIVLYEEGTNVVIAPNAVIKTTTTPGTLTSVTIDIKNTSSTDTIFYDVKRYDMVVYKKPSGIPAVPNFCFGGQCYGTDVLISIIPLELKPGERSNELNMDYVSLDADITETDTIGYSAIKYTIYNASNVTDSVQITVIYNEALQFVGIKENKQKLTQFNIFPNPTKGIVTLNMNAGVEHKSSLTIYNTIGELVVEKEVALIAGKNIVKIDLQHVASGIYIAQLKEGSTVTTRKIIIE